MRKVIGMVILLSMVCVTPAFAIHPALKECKSEAIAHTTAVVGTVGAAMISPKTAPFTVPSGVIAIRTTGKDLTKCYENAALDRAIKNINSK